MDTALYILPCCSEILHLLSSYVILGPDAQLRDLLGNSPLHLAVESAIFDRDIVQTLLEYGADVNSRDLKGRTALHNAATSGCYEAVTLLLASGVDPDIRDFILGMTPLNILVGTSPVKPDHYIVFQVLHGAGVDLELPDHNHATPIMNAIRNPDGTAFFIYLEKAGARCDTIDSQGMSILHHAAIWRDIELMNYILKMGRRTDNLSQTPAFDPDRVDKSRKRPVELLVYRSIKSGLWWTARRRTEEEDEAFLKLLSELGDSRLQHTHEHQRGPNLNWVKDKELEDEAGYYDAVNVLDASVVSSSTETSLESALPNSLDRNPSFTDQESSRPMALGKADVVSTDQPPFEETSTRPKVQYEIESITSPSTVPSNVNANSQTDIGGLNLYPSQDDHINDADSEAGSDSTVTASSIASSGTLMNHPRSLQVALTQVVALLNEDTSVHIILQTAVRNESLSTPKFDRHMRRLVRRFGRDFATDPRHDPGAAWFIQKYSDVISAALIMGALQEAGAIMSLRKAWISADDKDGNSSGFDLYMDYDSLTEGQEYMGIYRNS